MSAAQKLITRLKTQEERLAAVEARVLGVNEELKSSVWIIPKPDTGPLTNEEAARQIANIVRLMRGAYDDEELRELCLHMGVEFGSIGGSSTHQRIANLVRRFARENDLEGLLAHLRKTRPKVAWP